MHSCQYDACASGGCCTTCPVGSFCPGDDSIRSCGQGTFSNTTGASICTICPAGYFNNVQGSNSSAACRSCPAGTYSAPSLAVCFVCPIGTFNPNNGSSDPSACSPCPPGTNATASGLATCPPCPVGYFSNVSGSLCIAAPYNTFINTTGSTAPTPCPGGTFQCLTNQLSCHLTPAGSYRAATDMLNVAIVCPAGWTSLNGSSSCTMCPSGTFGVAATATEGGAAVSKVTPTTIIRGALGKSSNCIFINTGYSYTDPTLSGLASVLGYCQPCPSGTFSIPGSVTCQSCPSGTWLNNPNDTACSLCPAGTSNPLNGSTSNSSCSQCLPGTYSFAGASACTASCTKGTYSSQFSTACLACPAGTFNTVQGATSVTQCTPCPIGSFSLSGASQCSLCQSGSYSANMGQGNCTLCPSGSASTVIGANSNATCAACPAGTFSASAGQSLCTKCPNGTYNPSASGSDPSSCIPCPPGTFNVANGSTTAAACSPCTAGSYNDLAGQVKCKSCPPGTFNSNTSSSSLASCSPCPSGSSNPASGGSSLAACMLCPAGTIAAAPGLISCSLCPAGTFNSDLGGNSSASCEPCRAGTYSALNGSSVCTSCPQGSFYSQSGATSVDNCTFCPLGTSSAIVGATSNASCVSCLLGMYSSPVTHLCTVCPPGTYNPTALSSSPSDCLACPAGTTSTTPPSASCSLCSPGTYNPNFGQSCIQCPIGTFNAMNGSVSQANCQPCPIGTFSASVGARDLAACVACPPGTFNPSTGQASCTSCPAGTFGNLAGANSSSSCLPCASGSFNSLSGQVGCTQCPAGKYNPNTAASSGAGCVDCPLGSYNPLPGQSACRLCPSGFFSNATASTFCRQCPNNTFSSIEGALSSASCLPCPAGFFGNGTGQSSCAACPAGSFNPSPGASCLACPTGTFSTNSSATSIGECLQCGPGTIAGNGSAACSPCPTGTFNPSYGQGLCFPCPTGTFNPSQGGTSLAACQPCPSGTFGAVTGANSSGACRPCPAGTYSSLSGQSACLPCPGGTFSVNAGATSAFDCSMCPPGTFNPNNSSVSYLACTPCPAGTFSALFGQPSCSLCPAGTASNVTGSNTSSLCRPCTNGTFSSMSGQTTCQLCPAGMAPSSSSSSCSDCPPGKFLDPSVSSCTLCPTGTFNPNSGMLTCSPCPSGSFNPSTGSISASSCRLCPAGFYGPNQAATSPIACQPCAAGFFQPFDGQFVCLACPAGTFNPSSGSNSSASCAACPSGSFNALSGQSACTPCQPGEQNPSVGSTSASSCLLCAAGSYNPIPGQSKCTNCSTGSFTPIEGLTGCSQCTPGTFQNLVGQNSCIDCPIGTFTNVYSAVTCTPCPAGTYASSTRMESCASCPIGTLQPATGSSSCPICPTGLDSLPAPLATSDTQLVAQACTAYSNMIPLIWSSVATASMLSAQVRVTGSLPDWLTVVADSSLSRLSLSSLHVPPVASLDSPVLNFTVTITQNCRKNPWITTVYLAVQGSEASFLAGQSPTAAINACPDFAFTFGLQLGSCPSQVRVEALLANFSSVPSFVAFTFGGGVLQLTGTLPAGFDNLSVIGVIYRSSGKTIYSTVAYIVRSADSLPLFASPLLPSVDACPNVAVKFSLIPAKCGLTRLSVTFLNGSSLPSFLSYESDLSTLVVSGTVPEQYPTFSIIAVATTISNHTVTSESVRIVRPILNGSANLTISVLNSDGRVAKFPESVAVGGSTSVIDVDVWFGVTTTISIGVDSGNGARCSSSIPLVHGDAAPPQLLPSARAASSPGTSGLPSWLSINAAATSKLEFYGTPLKDSAQLSQSPFHFFVWANDGSSYPTAWINLTLHQSLTLVATSMQNTTGLGLALTTPSALMSLNIQVPLEAVHSVTLVCPAQGAITAFCSFDPSTGNLGAFGTSDGINTLLQSLRVATAAGMNISAAPRAGFLATDSVNPQPLAANIPLARLPKYPGLVQLQPITFNATIGKPVQGNINPYFSSPSIIAFMILGTVASDWLTVQNGFFNGVPRSPPRTVIVEMMASEKYTSITTNATLQLVWPIPPVANFPIAIQQKVLTSDMLDIRLPSSTFTDPENGTLVYTAGLDTPGTSPLPAFLTFDPVSMRLSGTPSPDDVGIHNVKITAFSRWGDWEGNATTVVQINVAMSWQDFFSYVYTMIGYGLSVMTGIASALVYRASLRNNFFPYRYRRQTLPEGFITGYYTLRDPLTEKPTPKSSIASVTVAALKPQKTEQNKSSWSTFSLVPWFAATQQRKQDVGLLDPDSESTGVPWVTFQTHRNKSVVVIVDIAKLEGLVASGEVLSDEEYMLEVTGSGWWSDGFVLEAFIFSPSCFLGEMDMEMMLGRDPPQNSRGKKGGVMVGPQINHRRENREGRDYSESSCASAADLTALANEVAELRKLLHSKQQGAQPRSRKTSSDGAYSAQHVQHADDNANAVRLRQNNREREELLITQQTLRALVAAAHPATSREQRLNLLIQTCCRTTSATNLGKPERR